MTRAILPGAVIGVLGSGQLGRMFAISARRMGYRVHTYSPEYDTPTGQVSDKEVRGSYQDLDALRAFAAEVEAVTFEFENIPAGSVEAISALVPVRPKGSVLHITQNRLREKRFLERAGFPVTPFEEVQSLQALRGALGRLGLPSVLKTSGWGYDGKGQHLLRNLDDAEAAWTALNVEDAIAESYVDFDCEVSVVAARGLDGTMADFGVVHNTHTKHILDVTVAPAAVDSRVAREAVEIARGILEALDVMGVLCVEFFLTRQGRLLVNELAPRPHNSGHFSFDACVTSQFEQQLRAICGLPLGSTALLRPAAMANLLGDLWSGQPPDFAAACAFPDVKLHLYGKAAARPGRKMGHLTALADTTDEARQRVLAARAALCPAVCAAEQRG